MILILLLIFFFSSRRRHTRLQGDWSSDVCSSDLLRRRGVSRGLGGPGLGGVGARLTRRRCAWAGSTPAMLRYHDREWGVPVHDERRLFEFLVLEGAQAGLSWATILNKRAAYPPAFARFDPRAVARFTAARTRALLRDEGIVRNPAKIAASGAKPR